MIHIHKKCVLTINSYIWCKAIPFQDNSGNKCNCVPILNINAIPGNAIVNERIVFLNQQKKKNSVLLKPTERSVL